MNNKLLFLSLIIFIMPMAYAALPVTTNVVLSATSINNYDKDNLTVTWTSSDADGNKIINITDWMVQLAGGTTLRSLAIVNLQFEKNGTYNASSYSTFGFKPDTVSGGPIWQPTGGHNKTGGYYFDGTDAYMSIPDNEKLEFNTGKFSISVWINQTAACPAGQECGIVAKGSGTTYKYMLAIYGNTYEWATYESLSARNPYIWTGTPSLGKWVHLVATDDGANPGLKLYINGASSGSQSGTNGALTDQATTLVIGRRDSDSGPYFPGWIDDIRIYNRTLSQAEVTYLSQSRNNVMSAAETTLGQNWSACIIPNDGTGDGIRKCSNNITIGVVTPSAPSISAISARPTNDSVRINWTTNQNSNTTINYGTTVSLGTKRTVQNSVTAHNTTSITTLTPNTLYYYNVSSCTNSLCAASGPNSFTTWQNVWVYINSTRIFNTTRENLTAYWNVKSGLGGKVVNITDWRVNGTSIAKLNFFFEKDWKWNATDYSYPKQQNATIVSTPTWTSTGGFLGTGAWTFDKKHGYLAITYPNLKINSSTVVFWAKNDTGVWKHIVRINQTTYVNGVIEAISNTHYMYSGTELDIGRFSIGAVSDPSTANMLVWYKADAAEPVYANNDDVGIWRDYSGNKNNATQGTAANKPHYITNAINGKPIIRWDGADSYLTLTNRLTTARTVITVHKWAATTGDYRFLFGDSSSYDFHGSTSGSQLFGCFAGGLNACNGMTWRNGTVTNPASTTAKKSLSYEIVSFNLSANTNIATIAVDRTFLANDRIFYGDYAEIIIYSNAATVSQLRATESYLSAKYAIPLSYGASGGADSLFNGTIDNFQIYNRSLTAAQINLLYRNQSNKINYNETRIGQNWTACITGNNKTNGPTVCSNIIKMKQSSCVCPGSNQNWPINMRENCNITTTCNIAKGNMTFLNAGNVRFGAAITTTQRLGNVSSGQTIWIANSCLLRIG